MGTIEKLFNFIDTSPSCYHAVENIRELLEAEGYRPLKESEKWKIVCGGKYYVNRNESSIAAFRIPEKVCRGFHIIASHSDSPCFKIKEKPEMTVENRYVKLNVEKYGGMIMSTWLDRPLSAAGRIVIEKDGHLESRNVNIDRDMLIIPNIAVHMNRDINKGVEYNPQTDMLPLFTEADNKKGLIDWIADEAGVKAKDILGSDLFLYNREKGRVLGAAGEFIAAPRLDDLECVFASVDAMAVSTPECYVNMIAVFDNEEVGSLTRQGAASTFLQDTLKRIAETLGITESAYMRMIAESFMISADNAHAVHPNQPDKADPTNRPFLNGGIVIKHHGSRKYTTDAMSAARMRQLCIKAGVPYQDYANRSDIAGGSTLGNISAAQVPVNTVDIGLAQLAMHSAYETAGSRDVEYMIDVFREFFSE